MRNPNIGFKIITTLLHFYDLDQAIRCNFSERALKAVSGMIGTLRQLRRAIQMDINAVAWIKGKEKEGENNATKSN